MTEPSDRRPPRDQDRPVHPRVTAYLLMVGVVLAIAALAVVSTFAGR